MTLLDIVLIGVLLGKGGRLVVIPSCGTVANSAEGLSKRLGRRRRKGRAGWIRNPIIVMMRVRVRMMRMRILAICTLRMGCMEAGGRGRDDSRRRRCGRLARMRVVSRGWRGMIIYRRFAV